MTLRLGWPRLMVFPVIAACTNGPLEPKLCDSLSGSIRSQGYQLDISVDEQGWLRSEGSRDGGVFIENGIQAATLMHGTSQGAAGLGPSGAAGIMIGSLIASKLARSNTRNAMESEAEARITPLRSALDGQCWSAWYNKAIGQALLHNGAAARETGGLVLSIAPGVLLSADARSIRLISEIRLMQGRKAIYQGHVEVFSSPLDCGQDCLAEWARGEGHVLKRELIIVIYETVRILQRDWSTQHFSAVSSAEKTLRYQVGGMRYVERGRVLEVDESRHLFLSLRGWLKSYPISGESSL
ncbi:hypothetical protein ACQKFS_18745 [Pseudomonas guineae]|uniref:hypothetical protein n=1 Tax=Pseudomonas guineae TaxID=425504 RepID=UPI003D08E6D6